MRFITFSFLVLSSGASFAGEVIQKELSYNVGLVNASFQEGEANLSGKNVLSPYSGSVSSISGMVNYKFLPGLERSYYAQGTFPLLPGATGSYFGAHLGSEFYFGKSSGSKMVYNNSGTTVKIKPKTLYFWGLEGGLGYLIYLTETQKKTDILLDLGANVGTLYTWSDRWRLRGTLGIARGTGVTTTAMEMKAFFGVTFYDD